MVVVVVAVVAVVEAVVEVVAARRPIASDRSHNGSRFVHAPVRRRLVAAGHLVVVERRLTWRRSLGGVVVALRIQR